MSDLVSFYTLLVSLLASSYTIPSGTDGYFFTEAGEFSFREIALEITKALELSTPPGSWSAAKATEEWGSLGRILGSK